jgi:hypothetical protein
VIYKGLGARSTHHTVTGTVKEVASRVWPNVSAPVNCTGQEIFSQLCCQAYADTSFCISAAQMGTDHIKDVQSVYRSSVLFVCLVFTLYPGNF